MRRGRGWLLHHSYWQSRRHLRSYPWLLTRYRSAESRCHARGAVVLGLQSGIAGCVAVCGLVKRLLKTKLWIEGPAWIEVAGTRNCLIFIHREKEMSAYIADIGKVKSHGVRNLCLDGEIPEIDFRDAVRICRICVVVDADAVGQ